MAHSVWNCSVEAVRDSPYWMIRFGSVTRAALRSSCKCLPGMLAGLSAASCVCTGPAPSWSGAAPEKGGPPKGCSVRGRAQTSSGAAAKHSMATAWPTGRRMGTQTVLRWQSKGGGREGSFSDCSVPSVYSINYTRKKRRRRNRFGQRVNPRSVTTTFLAGSSWPHDDLTHTAGYGGYLWNQGKYRAERLAVSTRLIQKVPCSPRG
eukprot:scaffold7177_cov75-Phaeocystis_antarctica.AAC.10